MVKAASKLARLQLSGDIRAFLKGIPVTGLEESQGGNFVYWAEGRLRTLEGPRVTLSIWFGAGCLHLTARMKDGREVTIPFSTVDDRARAARAMTDALDGMAN